MGLNNISNSQSTNKFDDGITMTCVSAFLTNITNDMYAFDELCSNSNEGQCFGVSWDQMSEIMWKIND